jgi:hypothetical protein
VIDFTWDIEYGDCFYETEIWSLIEAVGSAVNVANNA